MRFRVLIGFGVLLIGLTMGFIRSAESTPGVFDEPIDGCISFITVSQRILFTLDADGTNVSPMIIGYWIGSPVWSPDGKQIAFTERVEDNLDLYVLNVDGSGKRALTQDDLLERSPAWFPDSNRIVFTRMVGTGQTVVFDVDSSTELIVADIELHDFDISPDGQWIVAIVGKGVITEISLFSTDGTQEIQLTDNEFREWTPRWSPDGTQIAFASNRDGNDELYTMRPDGTVVARLTNTPNANEYRLRWSPDGQFIAYDIGYAQVWIMRNDGTENTRIENRDGITDFVWSPNGNYLAVSENQDIALYDVQCVGSVDVCGAEYRRIITESHPIIYFDFPHYLDWTSTSCIHFQTFE